jgi:segregation and condensation protein B
MVPIAGMSIKAKLEAVIYAAEEPVTLAQLATLFAEEALAWKAERDSAQLVESAGDTDSEPAAENAEFDYLEAEATAAAVAEVGEVSAVVEGVNPEARAGLGHESGSEPAGELEDAAAAEAAAKRLVRLRDREVRAILKQLLDELIAAYKSDGRGIEIREIAGGYRMATKPEFHDAVRSFVKSLKPPLKLSLQALETLAVIAYKQPVTAPEVNEIRGVDSSAVFGSLLARKLIATAGRKQVIGRPILYKTTREFLLRFGLKDVAELPSMEEFEKMAASELDDSEPTAEGESAPEISADLSLELDETASEEPGDESEARVM